MNKNESVNGLRKDSGENEVYDNLFFDMDLYEAEEDVDMEPYRNAIRLFSSLSTQTYVSISSKYLYFFLMRHMIKRQLRTSFYMTEHEVLDGSGLSGNLLNFVRNELIDLGVLAYTPSCEELYVKPLYRIRGV